MNSSDFSTESEAHRTLASRKRSRVLSAYFTLKEGTMPSYQDPEDAILYLIPMAYYESFFSTTVHDELVKKVMGLTN